VVIVQHPREARVGIGTARMAARCLPGASLVTGVRVENHPTVVDALEDPSRRPVLLWPGPDAKDLSAAPPTGPLTLFAVDGTWAQAKKVVRVNPRIAALPRYAIAPASPSEYRIRREPSAECLSTIEALAAALGVIEGDPDRYRAMLDPFRAMVEHQLAHMENAGPSRYRLFAKPPRRDTWSAPTSLRDPARVVVVAAETNAWPFDAPDRPPDEIVHWLAIRGDGSARFERVVRPGSPLAPGVSHHTGLAAEAILAGTSQGELAAAFPAFLRAGDAITTWGSYATQLLAETGLSGGRLVVDLRHVAADWLRGAPGSIERCADTMGASPPPLGPGRAGRRLALAWHVLSVVNTPRTPRHPVPD
jgi:DTW domain-containing protein YfiP